MTGYKVPGGRLTQRWFFHGATFGCIRAARMKTASRRRVDRAGEVTFKTAGGFKPRQLWVGDGNAGQKPLRVRVKRMRVNLVRSAFFHQLPQIHDPDMITYIANH